jgi:CheY-like chemotaxis protein
MSQVGILILEEEAIVAADLAGMLKRIGYKVDGIAGNSEEAVEMADRLQPDLLLMDIQLEGSINGPIGPGISPNGGKINFSTPQLTGSAKALR